MRRCVRWASWLALPCAFSRAACTPRPASCSSPARLTLLDAKRALYYWPSLRHRSRSLHATADIFQQLKANQDEPDPVAGAALARLQPRASLPAAACHIAAAHRTCRWADSAPAAAVTRTACFAAGNPFWACTGLTLRDFFSSACCTLSLPFCSCAAATVGVPDEAAGAGGAAPQEALTNQPAIDLLRRLPGGSLRPLPALGRAFLAPRACCATWARPLVATGPATPQLSGCCSPAPASSCRRDRGQLARAGAGGGQPG